MASTISAGTTAGTAIAIAGDTSGELQLRTNGTTTALTIGTNQNATFAGYVNAPNTFGFKNRIINGNMAIDQRNAGASTTGGGYKVDRWSYGLNGSPTFNIQQNAGSVTPPAGFTNYLGATSTSAYSLASTDRAGFFQAIEGLNVADLGWGTASAQTVTLSAWVRSSLTGTFGGVVANSAYNRCFVFSYSIPSANTWTYITATIAGDTTGTWLTNNGAGINVSFAFAAGSGAVTTPGSWGSSAFFAPTGQVNVAGTNGATFYITGVQLEVGSTATSFDYRPYGTEFALCQRYFQTIANGPGGSGSTTQFTFGTLFPVVMRTAPSASVTAAIRITDITTSAFTQSSGAISSNLVTAEGGTFHLPNFSGMTANRPGLLAQSSSGTIQLSAEL